MLDQKVVANIRESGLPQGSTAAEKRAGLLRQMGFRVADKAEYVVMTGCLYPLHVPHAMRAFSQLLRHFEVDYTLLHRDYCCGTSLLLQALRDKNEEELKQAQLLAREFLENNLRQVQAVRASKIVNMCPSCDMTYQGLKDAIPQEVLWYPTLLARLFRGGKLELKADYYASCHYLSKRLSLPLVDLDSALQVLNRIEGLELNHLNRQLCCQRPKQLEALADRVQSETVITTCGACTTHLQEALKKRGDYRVVMLPQVALAALGGHAL